MASMLLLDGECYAKTFLHSFLIKACTISNTIWRKSELFTDYTSISISPMTTTTYIVPYSSNTYPNNAIIMFIEGNSAMFASF